MNLTKFGIVYGLLATLAMTVVMVLGLLTRVSPMPTPIPVALAKWAFGDLPQPALMGLGALAHFFYGGLAGVVFVYLFKQKRILWTGFFWGALLWLGMQLVVLPLLGWGAFGTAITPKIAVATLVLHLIYGGVLGWATSRSSPAAG